MKIRFSINAKDYDKFLGGDEVPLWGNSESAHLIGFEADADEILITPYEKVGEPGKVQYLRPKDKS